MTLFLKSYFFIVHDTNFISDPEKNVRGSVLPTTKEDGYLYP